MSFRGVLMLLFAAVFGGAAVFMARGWIEAQVPKTIIVADKKQPEVQLATVVVAKRDLFFGDRLTNEFVQEVQWPANLVPAGAFKNASELAGQGRTVVRPIATNEPILASKLTGEGERATLSSVVTDDMRAVTISVNDVLGVAGYVLPGDRVDILLTREAMTNILLQNIKILGIDQNANDQADKPQVVRTVTVEATPYQGQKLTLAAQVGTLSLALRNNLDVRPAPQRTVTIADLGGAEINRSPNAALSDKNGTAKPGVDGVAVTPAAAVPSAPLAAAPPSVATDGAEETVVATPLKDPSTI